MSEIPLDERIRQNQIRNEQATYQRDQQVKQAKEEQKQQAQAELDQYNADVTQYNIDLANYNRELADIEAQQNAPTQDQKDEASYKTQYDTIIQQRDESLRNVPRTQTIVRKGADITRPASRKQIQIYENKIYQDYQRQLDNLTRTHTTQKQQKEFTQKYPGAVLGRTASNQVKAGSSYVDAYERQQANFESNRIAQSQRSAQTAQQQAKAQKTSYEQGVKELKQQTRPEPNFIFSKEPTKAGDLKKPTTPPERTLTQLAQEIIPPDPKNQQTYDAQQQAKQDLIEKTLATRTTKPIPRYDIQKPIQKDTAQAFLTKPPKNVNEIIGVDQQQSNKAVFTFEQTQKQQRELSNKLRSAKNEQEATAIKEQYQKINPYVGTKQTATKNGGITATQGIDIEKINISTKEEIKASYQPPKEITTVTETTTETTTTKEKGQIKLKGKDGKFLTYTNSKGVTKDLEFLSEESAQKYIDRTSKIITTETPNPSFYGFADSTGKPIKADSTILWQQANILIETKVKEPSKVDIEFNKSLRETLKTNPNVEIYKETKSAEPFIQDPLVKGLTDYGTEFVVMGEDVIKLANPNYEKKIKQTEHSLETVAFTEGIEQGKYLLAIPGAVKPKESDTKKYIDEKLKTPEGQQYLAGSVIASTSIGIATGGYSLLKQPLKTGVKEVNILKDIAENIYKPKIQDDFRTARLKELNPELSDTEIKRLSDTLYPKERTASEIKLTEMLKQNNPNLSQDRIDFIISQTQKTDAIKLYQKQQALREQLKKQYPKMDSKTIDQKVSTMTAKEGQDIPYSIEKINEKSYLISAGRESKETNAPFIVVNFNKSRFGKEKGTFEIYESAQGSFKPTDIVIQGVSKSELKGGRVISKSSSSTVTRYPTGKGNIYKILDPNQNELALIGTSKTGSLKELKQYPKEVIESMVKDERKTAILETKHETELLAKMEKSARQAYDTSLIKAKTTKTVKTESTTITKIPSKSEITKETNKIEIGTPGKQTTQTQGSNIKIPNKNNTEKLKDIARNTAKGTEQNAKTYQNIKSVSFLGLSQAGMSSMKLNTAQAQRTSQQQSTKLSDIQIGQQRDLTITIPDKAEITKQRDLITERSILKERITEKYKQVTTPRFSLIIVPGLGTKQDETTKLDIIEKYTLKTEQTTSTIFKYTTKPDEPFLKPRIPGGTILPDLTKKEKQDKALTGLKPKTVYFSWNVNLEEPGRYLPTADLVVGTKKSILNRTNKIQRQVSSGAYSKKQDKGITGSMDKSLTKPTQNRSTKSFMKKEKQFKFKIKV